MSAPAGDDSILEVRLLNNEAFLCSQLLFPRAARL